MYNIDPLLFVYSAAVKRLRWNREFWSYYSSAFDIHKDKSCAKIAYYGTNDISTTPVKVAPAQVQTVAAHRT
jgi:hypothetical protein